MVEIVKNNRQKISKVTIITTTRKMNQIHVAAHFNTITTIISIIKRHRGQNERKYCEEEE